MAATAVLAVPLLVATCSLLLAQAAAESDVTLKLDLSVFDLDLDDGDEGGGGMMAALLTTDAEGRLVVVDAGTANMLLLGLTQLIPIPEEFDGQPIDAITMVWSSPTESAYSLSVELIDTAAHVQAGWIAANVMEAPTLSVASDGRIPAEESIFTIGISCQTTGKASMQFTLKICEDETAVWSAATSSCSSGAVQTVEFQVDKECGGGGVLPGFCAPPAPTAMRGGAADTAVSVFNLNVAEGAGVDRTKLAAKGAAIAEVVAAAGYDLVCLQEVWVGINPIHFRKTATDYDRKPGINRLSCTAK